MNINMGRITRNNDNPDDFSAVSSFFSDKFPKVMMDEKSTANGSASGIKVAET